MLERLKRLCSLPGISGHEGPVRAFLKAELAPLGLETFTDPLGNLYVHQPGSGPRILLAAHMDEVGMVVSGIREDGTLAYSQAGIDARALAGKRVRIGPNGLAGIIGCKAIHLQKEEEFKRAFPHEELYLDIGAKDKAQAQAAVRIGDPVWFDGEPMEMGGLLCAKALDDRIGCTIVAELLKEPYACDLWAVFTVQEELGLRGAMAAACRVEPALALVLEGTTANDLPGRTPPEAVTRVGGGAAITVMDGRTLALPEMVAALIKTAETHAVAYQLRRGVKGGTDGGAIHKALTGCPVGGISVPCRYIHSPNSLASPGDIQAAYALALAFLQDKMWNEVIRHA
ncbi:MAG: M42 family peptidase [Candidatus Pelethousia sp.]|nr:M42 family peptidase [Candidatus Pelethousia sp.]